MATTAGNPPIVSQYGNVSAPSTGGNTITSHYDLTPQVFQNAPSDTASYNARLADPNSPFQLQEPDQSSYWAASPINYAAPIATSNRAVSLIMQQLGLGGQPGVGGAVGAQFGSAAANPMATLNSLQQFLARGTGRPPVYGKNGTDPISLSQILGLTPVVQRGMQQQKAAQQLSLLQQLLGISGTEANLQSQETGLDAQREAAQQAYRAKTKSMEQSAAGSIPIVGGVLSSLI